MSNFETTAVVLRHLYMWPAIVATQRGVAARSLSMQESAEVAHKGLVIAWLERPRPFAKVGIMDMLAANGQVGALRALFGAHHEEFTYIAVKCAANNGHAETVALLCDMYANSATRQTSANEDLMWAMGHAACSGHLSVVRVIHRTILDSDGALNFIGFGKYILEHAALDGHLDVLRFFHENRRSPCDPNGERIGTQLATAVDIAARGGNVEMVRSLCDWGYECTTVTMQSAARRGRLEVVRFLHAHGCAHTMDVMEVAAHFGQLEIIRFFHDMGCAATAYTQNAMEEADDMGHTDISKFFREHGYAEHTRIALAFDYFT
jgi:hypothetical protein